MVLPGVPRPAVRVRPGRRRQRVASVALSVLRAPVRAAVVLAATSSAEAGMAAWEFVQRAAGEPARLQSAGMETWASDQRAEPARLRSAGWRLGRSIKDGACVASIGGGGDRGVCSTAEPARLGPAGAETGASARRTEPAQLQSAGWRPGRLINGRSLRCLDGWRWRRRFRVRGLGDPVGLRLGRL